MTGIITVVKKGTPGEYIGRGSPLGNPFVLGRDGDRDAVCDKYKARLLVMWNALNVDNDTPKEIDELFRLARLHRAGDLNLVCFCAPQRCHGDFVKEMVELINNNTPTNG